MEKVTRKAQRDGSVLKREQKKQAIIIFGIFARWRSDHALNLKFNSGLFSSQHRIFSALSRG
jgi:hypothetical protein